MPRGGIRDAARPPRPSTVHQRHRRGACRPGRRAGAGRRRSPRQPRLRRPEPAGQIRISSSSTPRSIRWTRERRGRRPSPSPAGRFTAVGSTSDIKGLAGKNTQTFDAKGMTVVPGFIDCHNHAGGEVLLNEVLVGNPFEVEFVSIRSIIGKLRERAQQTPPGTWVEGYFFDDTKLSDKRALNIHDLDEVSTRASGDRPPSRRAHLLLQQQGLRHGRHHQGHAQPDGRHLRQGRDRPIERAGDDLAAAPFNKIGTRPTYTPARGRAARARWRGAHLQAVRALRPHHRAPRGRQPARDAGRTRRAASLRHRISYEASGRVLDAMITAGIQSGFGDDWIRFGATSEHTVDGSFSERTMALSTPYPGRDAALQGQRHRDPGHPERVGGARAPGRHPGELPRQRRRRHRHVPDRRRTGAEAGASSQRPAEDHALHAGQSRAGPAHQGHWRGAGALHDLRLLQPRQVRLLRRGDDEALHGVPLAGRRRRLCRGRLGLQPGAVRAADGDPGHGHAQGMGRQGLGRQPAPQRQRGHRRQHLQWRLGLRRGSHQGLDHRRQAGRLRGPRRRPAHCRCREDQGHPDRAHGGGRNDFAPGVSHGGTDDVSTVATPRLRLRHLSPLSSRRRCWRNRPSRFQTGPAR